MKKTLSQKNLAAKHNYNSANNTNFNLAAVDDRTVYTVRAGTNAFVSPRNTVENSYTNQQDESLKFDQDQQHHYNKASSYLSSQKMTPNMQSMDHSSNSHRGLTAQKQYSNTHFANSRTLNSFFSQPSQIGFAAASTPSGHNANNMASKIEDSQYQQSSDMKRKAGATGTGRVSKQSNTSYDSNVSQTVKQSKHSSASRQSTAQQMYQAYKNKYLNKK